MELINIIYNKNLIKEFLENKIVLNCKTRETAQNFFNYLDKNNYINKEETKELLRVWNEYEENTCYQYEDKRLYYDSKYYYINKEPKEIKEWKKR